MPDDWGMPAAGSLGRESGSPSAPEPVRFARVSAAARQILQTQSESERFEFKADSKATTATVLVAAANWAALDPEVEFVTILVGVEEVVDDSTGLTTGRVIGLSGNDLSLHVRRIQDYAASTRPVPVAVRIVEEGVSTAAPFLRVEVRPTFPPHFDGAGRRVTRNGASTRALEDEELLAFYLDRETRQFEARFQATAQQTIDAITALQTGLGSMAATLERLPQLIDGAEAAAYSAGYDAEEARTAIRDLDSRTKRLERKLAERLNRTPDYVFLRLRYARRGAWRLFNIDRLVKPSKSAEALGPRLLRLLDRPIDIDEYLGNLAQVQHWERVLKERQPPASMRWWLENVRTAEALNPRPDGTGITEDLEALQAEISKAEYWSELEWDPWPTDSF